MSDVILNAELSPRTTVLNAQLSDGVKGTNDYEKLIHKPSLNGVQIVGDKTSADYRVQDRMNALSVQDIEKILYLG